MVTLVISGIASYLHEITPTSGLIPVSVALAGISFAYGRLLGLLLWFRLWAWFFAAWSGRSNLKNMAWGIVILTGSIVLPLFMRDPHRDVNL